MKKLILFLLLTLFLIQCNSNREDKTDNVPTNTNTNDTSTEFSSYESDLSINVSLIKSNIEFNTTAIGRSSSKTIDDGKRISITNSGIAHPSIVYIPNGFNGYKYWMAMTPYFGKIALEKNPAEFENPHIFASNNGIDWVDISNGPLDRPSCIGVNSYWSDVNLLYENNELILYYRGCFFEYNYFNDNKSHSRAIVARTSSDGVNWSDKKLVYSTDSNGANNNSLLLSPSFLKVNDNWMVYDVIASTDALKIDEGYGNQTKRFVSFRQSNSFNGDFENFSIKNICKFSNRPWGNDRDPWHLEVLYSDSKIYIMLLDVGYSNQNYGDTLYLAYSKDGKNFTVIEKPIINESYKSTFFLKQQNSKMLKFWLYQSKPSNGSINLYEMVISKN